MTDYCYVCRQRGEDLVWDDEAQASRHADCSLSSVAKRLPVTIDDLKVGIQNAEEAVLSPAAWAEPYREAWTTLRGVARQALENLTRLEIPVDPPDPILEQVLDEIEAEGHADIDLTRYPANFGLPARWRCASHTAVHRPNDEEWPSYASRSHRGEADGATALEAASKRLEQIRAGGGLGVLVSWFLPDPVDVEIREAVAEADAIPHQIEDL